MITPVVFPLSAAEFLARQNPAYCRMLPGFFTNPAILQQHTAYSGPLIRFHLVPEQGTYRNSQQYDYQQVLYFGAGDKEHGKENRHH